MVGFVTAESVLRLWTPSGAHDWMVTDDAALRDALGRGNLERGPMAPDALTDMALLDRLDGTLSLIAPFDAGERPRLLARPFRMAPVTTTLPGRAIPSRRSKSG